MFKAVIDGGILFWILVVGGVFIGLLVGVQAPRGDRAEGRQPAPARAPARPPELRGPRVPLHVVLDNSSTHSTPELERWLQRHKRVHFHFTPTSASWMNMVEIWFSILTSQQVRRGVYHDVPELIAAIEHFIDNYNQRAQPFVWTKTADEILTKATKQQPTSGTLH